MTIQTSVFFEERAAMYRHILYKNNDNEVTGSSKDSSQKKYLYKCSVLKNLLIVLNPDNPKRR